MTKPQSQIIIKYSILFSKIFRYVRYYPEDIIRIFLFTVFIGLFYLSNLRSPNNAEFVHLVYAYFLFSPISEEELSFYKDNLDRGNFSRIQVILSYLMLPIGIEQKLFSRTGMEAHHLARVKLVQEMLPQAEYILDLGGSSPGSPEGALMVMGYPYNPQQLDIIDLPQEERIYNPQSEEHPQQFITPDNLTKINYIYHSMADLSNFPEHAVDLVWSGQSIEHVTEEEAEKVIQEVFRVIKPGGSFCLDTPNRQLTKLLVRGGFVHPEHKIEYTPDELITKIQKAGFIINKKLAVSPMPYSLKTKRFSKLELMNSISFSENINQGFSFFIYCSKPDN
ncbi:MAG: methyltransferase domain-containing protein [Nostoc sp.]|uniref:methyltransferase domain-containing protein n=1 Tax=Nostoc sp. TaxID=1180 RepID=UPI002FF86AFF